MSELAAHLDFLQCIRVNAGDATVFVLIRRALLAGEDAELSVDHRRDFPRRTGTGRALNRSQRLVQLHRTRRRQLPMLTGVTTGNLVTEWLNLR